MEPSLYGYSLDDFKDEAKELLTRAEGILSEITESPHDSDKVNALFRVIHSLKGSAAYAGLRDVDSFAHLYESLLGELRNSKGEVKGDVLTILVRARDYLEDLVFHPEDTEKLISDGGDGGPMQQLSMLLNARREKKTADTAPLAAVTGIAAPPVPDSPMASGFKIENVRGLGGIRPLSPPLGNVELEPIPEEARPLTHKITLSTEDPVKMNQKDVIRVSIKNSLKSLFSAIKDPSPDKGNILKGLKKLEETALWAFGDDASDVMKSLEKMRTIVSGPGSDEGVQLKKEFNSLSMALKGHLFALDGPMQEKQAEVKEEVKAEAEVKEKKRISPEEVRGASKDDIVKITLFNALETLAEFLNEGAADPFQIKRVIKRLRDLNTWAFNDDKEVGIRIKFLEDLVRRPYDEVLAQEMRDSCASLKALFADLLGEKEEQQGVGGRVQGVGELEEEKQERKGERGKGGKGEVDSPIRRFADSPTLPVAEHKEARGQRSKPAPALQASTLRVKSEDLESLISTIGELAGLDPKDFEKLQAQVLQLRMVPVGELFSRFRKVVRDISEELGKEIDIEISGESVKLDKVIADRLNEPIMHMVRNAAGHGLEAPDERRSSGKSGKGLIRLNAYQEGGQIIIEVSDNGRGISLKAVRERAIEMGLIKSGSENVMPEKAMLDLIFTPGFSTSKEADRVSGRGVGMDVVKDVITSLQGTVSIETKEGKGTTFRLQLPLTLAVIKAMVLEQSGTKIALPSAFVDRVITMTVEEIEAESIMDNNRLSLDLAGEGDVLPLVDLAKLFAVENKNKTRCVVLVKAGMGQKAALVVDATFGRQPIMVKPLDRFAENRYFSSAAFVDNELILVLNTPSLMAA